MWRTSILALTLGLAGCGARGETPASLAGLSPGTTTLRITNHVIAPGELDRITVSVDGEVVPLTSVPPEGGAAAVLGALRLAPGPHQIAVRARAHTQGSDIIVVGAQQPFHVAEGPAAITIDVRSGMTNGGVSASPVAVVLSILGGKLAPEIGVPPPDDKDERCGALLPIPRALCRAAVDLDDAERKNDVVAAMCVRDKLTEMRKLALVGETGKGDSVAIAEAQVAALSRKVELCINEFSGSSVPPDGVTIKRVR